MSQEPNPSESEAQPSVAQPSTSEQTEVQARPVLRSASIKVLRSTIQALESLVEKLEKSPTEAASQPLVSPEQLRSGWQRFSIFWRGLLSQIRDRLPENVSQKLNDRALTGIVAGTAIVLIWTVSNLSSPKPVEVAIAPSPTVFPPELTAPVEPTPISPTPTSTDSAEQPAEVPADPVPPTPVVEPSPVAPPLELTPEQSLIASIQDQVAEVTNQYASGLIQSVQANFRTSQLSVKVSNGWYDLSQAQQDKLAAELLSRSQELDFSKLEMTDSEATLLARSPVVGSSMVILRRKSAATV